MGVATIVGSILLLPDRVLNISVKFGTSVIAVDFELIQATICRHTFCSSHWVGNNPFVAGKLKAPEFFLGVGRIINNGWVNVTASTRAGNISSSCNRTTIHIVTRRIKVGQIQLGFPRATGQVESYTGIKIGVGEIKQQILGNEIFAVTGKQLIAVYRVGTDISIQPGLVTRHIRKLPDQQACLGIRKGNRSISLVNDITPIVS